MVLRGDPWRGLFGFTLLDLSNINYVEWRSRAMVLKTSNPRKSWRESLAFTSNSIRRWRRCQALRSIKGRRVLSLRTPGGHTPEQCDKLIELLKEK